MKIVFPLFLTLCGLLQAAPETPRAPYSLELWKDPRFARFFVGSYGTLPDLEPEVNAQEQQALEQLLPLMTKPREAYDYLAKIINKDSNPVFSFHLASLYFENGMLPAAEKWYLDALEKAPAFRRAWRSLGMAQVRMEKWRDAVRSLGKAIGLGIQDGPTYGLLGFSLLALDRPASAESAYRQALMFEPDSIDWKLGLVRTALQQSKAAEAAALCGEILREHPDRIEMLSLQAEAYLAMNEHERATENLELLVRSGQAKPADLKRLADIYTAGQEPALAVTAYVRWLERDDFSPSEDVKAAVAAAESLSAQNALHESGLLLAKARQVGGDKLDKDTATQLLNLEARLKMHAGKGDEAAPILQRVIELNPLDGAALMLLGQHYTDKGDAVKAANYYERAVKIKETEPEALIRLAQIHIAAGKLSEALPLLKRSQEAKPRDSVQRLIQDLEKFMKRGAR